MTETRVALEKAIRVIKIEMDPEEQNILHGDLIRFLEWLKPLEELDASGVTPVRFSHVTVNEFRDDQALSCDLEEVRKAAPNFDEGFYTVPPIIE